MHKPSKYGKCTNVDYNRTQSFWEQLRAIVEQVILESDNKTRIDSHTERPLLKSKEVCEILHISKPAIYDRLKQGKIKSVKIQSRRYFH